MAIRDKNMDWLRPTLWMPFGELGSFGPSPEVGESGATVHAIGAMVPGAHAGAPAIEEISTFGYSGLELAANSDAWCRLIPVPSDVDPAFELGFRVGWTANDTATPTILFTVQLDFKAAGAALITPATALSTILTADELTVAYGWEMSPRGVKNKDFLTRQQIENRAVMLIEVIATTIHTGITAGNAWFFGVEMDYAPFRTRGTGMGVNPPTES